MNKYSYKFIQDIIKYLPTVIQKHTDLPKGSVKRATDAIDSMFMVRNVFSLTSHIQFMFPMADDEKVNLIVLDCIQTHLNNLDK